MADFYVNSLTGNNGNTGGSGDPWLTLVHANTQISSTDTLVVEYAGGTAYAHGAALDWTSGANLTGRDGSGVRWDQSPLTFNREQLPLLTWGATDGLTTTVSSAFSVQGLWFQGTGPANTLDILADFGTVATMTVEGCKFTDARNTTFKQATIRECWFENMNLGIGLDTGCTVTVHSCIFKNIDYYSGALRPHGIYFDTGTLNVENCTFYLNGNGDTYGAIRNPANATLLKNLLLVDNICRNGLPGGQGVNCNAYRSNPSLYHTTANFSGGASGTDTELDAQFIDAANGNFYIQNATLKTGGAVGTAPRLFDGTPMPATPPVGALGGLSVLKEWADSSLISLWVDGLTTGEWWG